MEDDKKLGIVKQRISSFCHSSKYVKFEPLQDVSFPSLVNSLDEIGPPQPSYSLNFAKLVEQATPNNKTKEQNTKYKISKKIEIKQKKSKQEFPNEKQKLYELIQSKFDESNEKLENDILQNPSPFSTQNLQRPIGQTTIDRTMYFLASQEEGIFSYRIEKYKPTSVLYPDVEIPDMYPID